jgi:hypothetical protein
MKSILIRSVFHAKQRYDTCGDYFEHNGQTEITISDMQNEIYEQLVAVHELIEKILVTARGISDASIDAFDMAYEDNRRDGDDSEPGDNELAPYYAEHQFATAIERRLAAELGVDWDHYDKTVTAL